MDISGAGIIVQARMGSTRLPGKVLMPFHGEKTILQIILDTMKNNPHGLPVVLATSTSVVDEPIAAMAEAQGITVFRGDESNVLVRFIDTASASGFSKIFRVCADNPFLDRELFAKLVEESLDSDADYCSFEVAEGLPAILSHWGIFAEYVSLNALLRVQELTKDKLYYEHVTNYIYKHPVSFNIKWVKAPAEIYEHLDYRFTIDTPVDFEIQQQLYRHFAEQGITSNFKDLIRIVNETPGLGEKMKEQIRNNSK
jgi:spore coat polysaccharide biosynthesis protein SpsF (cytidylyltransferase family)